MVQLNEEGITKGYRLTLLVLYSLSGFQQDSSGKGLREFVYRLTSHMKAHQIAILFTSVSNYGIDNSTTVTVDHISTITDSIILLRYVEFIGEMHRGLTALKMRG